MVFLSWQHIFHFLLLIQIPTTRATHSPKLDLNNEKELLNATTRSIENLLKFYTPTDEGVFDQVDTPWWESGVIWWTLFEYAKWTGDNQFLNIATGALVNSSWGKEHDFLGGDSLNATAKLEGHWNDDIMWTAQAVTAGAEVLGPESVMGHSKQSWISLTTKSFDEVASQIDQKCGGGIYWYRDRKSATRGNYKAVITQLQFISNGARNYLLTGNDTLLEKSNEILNWVLTSGVSNPKTGVIQDGVSVTNCSDYTERYWSYSYGELLGSLAWMHKATRNQTYLELATPFFEYALAKFAGPNTSGVIAELCEDDHSCNRDQKSFKSVFALNMVYLYHETTNQTMKTMIRNMLDTSVTAMIKHSCDDQWNCGGNWTSSEDYHSIKSVTSQHVSTALLLSSIGIRRSVSTGAVSPFHGKKVHGNRHFTQKGK